jgi:hypothetical protein
MASGLLPGQHDVVGDARLIAKHVGTRITIGVIHTWEYDSTVMSAFGDDLTDSIIEGHLTSETSESKELRFLRDVETLCFDRADIAVDYGHLIHE